MEGSKNPPMHVKSGQGLQHVPVRHVHRNAAAGPGNDIGELRHPLLIKEQRPEPVTGRHGTANHQSHPRR